MDLIDFARSHAPRDPTWERALTIAREKLHASQNVQALMRSGWRGQLETTEFIRYLSFSRFDLMALLEAAELPLHGKAPDITFVQQALRVLGPRHATVILAVGYLLDKIFVDKDSLVCRRIRDETLINIEIGCRVGLKCYGLGADGGMLVGLLKGLGLGLLLQEDPAEFERWFMMTNGYQRKEMMLKVFGCEPFQVASAAVQYLGFGPELAVGTAIAVGDLDTKELNLGDEYHVWKAAYQWIEALRDGRSHPRSIDMRTFFRETSPSTDPTQPNVVLEALYNEAGTIRRRGAHSKWHIISRFQPPPLPVESESKASAEEASPPPGQ